LGRTPVYVDDISLGGRDVLHLIRIRSVERREETFTSEQLDSVEPRHELLWVARPNVDGHGLVGGVWRPTNV